MYYYYYYYCYYYWIVEIAIVSLTMTESITAGLFDEDATVLMWDDYVQFGYFIFFKFNK